MKTAAYKPTKVKLSTYKMYNDPNMFGGVVGDAVTATRNIWLSVPAAIGAFVLVNRWQVSAQPVVIEIPAPVTARYTPEKVYSPAPAAKSKIAPITDETAAIVRKYLWIADSKKRMYKSTIQNGKVNRAAELAQLEALNVTAEFQQIGVSA